MSSTAPVVVKRKLKFKGDSATAAKSFKRKATPATESTIPVKESSEEKSATVGVTETQRKHKQQRTELEDKQMQRLVKSSYRERVESFNYKLSRMTEHVS